MSNNEEKHDGTFDFSKPLLALGGKQVIVSGEVITIADEIGSTLVVPAPNETGKEKLRSYRLAMRIMDSPASVELSPGDIVFITKKVSQFASPLVVGQLVELTGQEPED